MLTDLDKKVTQAVADKVILITGAAGTIGRALTRRLISHGPRVVRLLDHNEEEIFALSNQYANREDVRALLGDIRDRERMKRAMQDVDIVFHAAALKHVSLGEYNPFEVVRTNLIALQNLIECCIDANVGKFIFTSSDKAVNPTNVMGGSKFIGERLVTAGNAFRGKSRTILTSTRFGNVMGSAGSVVPVFRSQIAAGGPVTVTHQEMTRFFMTERQSVDLLLSALVASLGGEVFVPLMHCIKIIDLAETMIELFAEGKPIEIKVSGLRPGEKMYEELFSQEELSRCLETSKLLIVLPFEEEADFVAGGRKASKLGPPDYPDRPAWATKLHSSRTAAPLKRSALLDLLSSEFGDARPRDGRQEVKATGGGQA